jgi:hypothetical protein
MPNGKLMVQVPIYFKLGAMICPQGDSNLSPAPDGGGIGPAREAKRLDTEPNWMLAIMLLPFALQEVADARFPWVDRDLAAGFEAHDNDFDLVILMQH